MTFSQRIALNTVTIYSCTVLGAAFSIFSSRWVLNALGSSDFGLFGVVGSVICFITFFNGVLAASSARHFAFSIGQGQPEEVNKWFNTALCIHFILPAILISVGAPIGEYCIRHVFVINADRIGASLWVFRISLLTAFINMTSIPYIAMYTAKQEIFELAIWGIVQSIICFGFAYNLRTVTCDKMLFYAGYAAGTSIFAQVAQIIRATWKFKECQCHFNHWFDRVRFKEIVLFASWNLIGSVGAMVRNQGCAILLNMNFGTKVNASFAVANSVSSQTLTLSTAMVTSFAPAVTSVEGGGERQRVLYLALQFCKFGTYLLLFFVIPLMLEMDYVLDIWLKTPPQYTTEFCWFIIITFVLDRMTGGQMTAVNAKGKIAAYQASLGTILILTLPLAWLFIKLGFSPLSVGAAFVITQACCSLGRVFWARHLLGMPVLPWVKEVVIPCLLVTGIASGIASIPRFTLAPSVTRFVLVGAISVTLTAVSGWFLLLDAKERTFLMNNISNFKRKLTRR